jgi:hypothetical protein
MVLSKIILSKRFQLLVIFPLALIAGGATIALLCSSGHTTLAASELFAIGAGVFFADRWA